jgi:RNA polymerase sigma-70 factor (ECF subfamily)
MAGALPLPSLDDAADRLASLFDAHHDRLYRLARRLAANGDDAHDLVQETFLRAARSPASVPLGNTCEEAWLVRVLINISRDQWRKTSVRRRHESVLIGPRAVSADQEAGLMARAVVWRALDTLTPRRRAVVVMHELEGQSAREIASLLGLAAVTVRWHLAMGRRDLARMLTPHVGDIR